MQDLPFIPATVPPDSVSIRLQTQQNPHPKQNNTSYDSDSHQHKQLVRVRGPLVKAACLACRKRKSKCNGDRPSCKICTDRATECEYTVNPGQSQRQAMNKQLEAYKYVLDLLRQGSVTECRTLLLSLKSHGSVAEAVESINRDRWTREDGEGAGAIWFEQWGFPQSAR
ncbi:hypothetical protein D6D19_07248 [Aureobasidium pullulans]|uniref:Zn(2)-C6 fungal-type domain-containing protein n=1 Tax=Aureobasidium pullulans TaxID=5580 RepID=A0A4S8ZYX8_AURPU|nr:hypothetical protein D6D19_07248 [Aureobasidium pullulans]